LSSAGPKDVDGIGNYVLKVKSADASRTQLLTLYMLDSHAYTTKRLPGFFGWFQKLKYDWIKQSQIDWFLVESANHQAFHARWRQGSWENMDATGVFGSFGKLLGSRRARERATRKTERDGVFPHSLA